MTRRLPALVRAAAGLLAAACLLAGAARAEVSGSASVVSDYRYRGVSLSNGEPAAQVDLNYDDRSGAYAGAFVSNVRLGTPPAALVQWVPYGGASLRLANGVALDAGASYSELTSLSELVEHFPAAHHRHHQIEQHHIRMPSAELLERLHAVLRAEDLVALLLQEKRERPADLRVVVHHKHGSGARQHLGHPKLGLNVGLPATVVSRNVL